MRTDNRLILKELSERIENLLENQDEKTIELCLDGIIQLGVADNSFIYAPVINVDIPETGSNSYMLGNRTIYDSIMNDDLEFDFVSVEHDGVGYIILCTDPECFDSDIEEFVEIDINRVLVDIYEMGDECGVLIQAKDPDNGVWLTNNTIDYILSKTAEYSDYIDDSDWGLDVVCEDPRNVGAQHCLFFTEDDAIQENEIHISLLQSDDEIVEKIAETIRNLKTDKLAIDIPSGMVMQKDFLQKVINTVMDNFQMDIGGVLFCAKSEEDKNVINMIVDMYIETQDQDDLN